MRRLAVQCFLAPWLTFSSILGFAQAGTKPKAATPKLEKVTVVLSTTGGGKPSKTPISIYISYGEATVATADSLSIGKEASTTKALALSLPVQYDLGREYLKQGPNVCVVAHGPLNSDKWAFDLAVDFAYREGKTVRAGARGYSISQKQSSFCKDIVAK